MARFIETMIAWMVGILIATIFLTLVAVCLHEVVQDRTLFWLLVSLVAVSAIGTGIQLWIERRHP